MTDRERLIDALNAAFTHKLHSLAEYIAQARPYVPPGRQKVLVEIQALAAEDARVAGRLAETIERLEGIPQAGSRPAEVAELNYLSLDYLLRVLIETRQKELKQYAAFLAEFGRDDAGGAELARLHALSAAQLERLRALVDPPNP
jgi:bacterioferritin (cytochrome b1)